MRHRGVKEFQSCQVEGSLMIASTAAGGAAIRVIHRMLKEPDSPYVGVGMGGRMEAVTGLEREIVGSEVGGYTIFTRCKSQLSSRS
jgi:hypothetical protein